MIGSKPVNFSTDFALFIPTLIPILVVHSFCIQLFLVSHALGYFCFHNIIRLLEDDGAYIYGSLFIRPVYKGLIAGCALVLIAALAD